MNRLKRMPLRALLMAIGLSGLSAQLGGCDDGEPRADVREGERPDIEFVTWYDALLIEDDQNPRLESLTRVGLRNNSDRLVSVDSVTIGDGDDGFRVAGPIPSSIASGQVIELVVGYNQPDNEDAFVAEARLVADTSVGKVELLVVAERPSHYGPTADFEPCLELTSAHAIEFLDVPVTETVTDLITVQSCSSTPIVVTGFEVSTADVFSLPNVTDREIVIGAFEQTQFTLAFTPLEAGVAYDGVFVLDTNAANTPRLTVPLYGEGAPSP